MLLSCPRSNLLLEGCLGNELKLLLFFCISDKKFFGIDWLNMQIASFAYTYLETDKPELIRKQDVIAEGKLKQTSGAMHLD